MYVNKHGKHGLWLVEVLSSSLQPEMILINLYKKQVVQRKNKNSLSQKLKNVHLYEKKEEIWLSLMTKDPTSTEKSKKQSDNTKTAPKNAITQRLRTDLGRSVWVTIATKLVWLNWFTGSKPSFWRQQACNQKDIKNCNYSLYIFMFNCMMI